MHIRCQHVNGHSPAHMGSKKKKPFSGPLYDGYSQPRSKRQKQLVEAGQCRDCGSALGRAVTVCHVLLVEVTKQFFAAHEKAVFVLKGSGNLHVGPDGKVVN